MELFTDGFPEFFTPVGVGVAVLLQVLISLFSLGYVIGMYLLILGIDSLVAALDLLDSRY